jgi:hypothetical protein
MRAVKRSTRLTGGWQTLKTSVAALLAVRCIGFLDVACDCTLAKLNVHTIRVCRLKVSCVSRGRKNLNQAVVNPCDLDDWRTTDARHNFAGTGRTAEANLCLKAVKRMAVDANDTEDSRTRRRSMLRL